MKLELVYEDADIVAYNKPSGLLSIPDRYNDTLPCLYHLAAKQHDKLFVIHRLDKDTSGLICFAKNEKSHKYMSELFQGRAVAKYYLALVDGQPMKPSGSIIAPIAEQHTHKGRMCVQKKGRFAHTDYEVLKTWNSFSLLKLRIHTGRTHQIRVHLQHLGNSIVCDPFYGRGGALMLSAIKKKFKLSQNEEEERPLLNRLALHASSLAFKNEQGEDIVLEAPLYKDMEVALKQLDKWGR